MPPTLKSQPVAELSRYTEPDHVASVTAVREALLGDHGLVCVEVAAAAQADGSRVFWSATTSQRPSTSA